jgi:nicotinamide mononucleotide transporter
MLDWFVKNYNEILGVIASILFTIFSIKQKPVAWIFGFFSAALYAYVYFHTKLYASMSLQGYYLAISVYGWFYWIKGEKKENSESKRPVIQVPFRQIFSIGLIWIAINLVVWWILGHYTDSPYPVLDSFTTTGGIIATWMLAQKYIENWLLWIVIDITSAGLYLHIALYPTAVLFIVYIILAITGYLEWRKNLKSAKSLR